LPKPNFLNAKYADWLSHTITVCTSCKSSFPYFRIYINYPVILV
jgi:hypothetical protein